MVTDTYSEHAIIFHGNNGFGKAGRYYVISTLPALVVRFHPVIGHEGA